MLIKGNGINGYLFDAVIIDYLNAIEIGFISVLHGHYRRAVLFQMYFHITPLRIGYCNIAVGVALRLFQRT